MPRSITPAASFLLVLLAACAGGEDAPGVEVERTTLANGATRLVYGALDAADAPVLEADLRIGAFEGEGPEVFGDVRAVDADAEGNIYVLDFPASEIRVFDAQGRHLRTIGGKGEGPGEISASTGFALAADGTLWVHDHGQWRWLHLTASGEEIERVPLHVPSWGYMTDVVIDARGRLWKPTSHSDEPRAREPEPGISEWTARSYWKSLDPASGAIDSVFVGEISGRTHIARWGSGARYSMIPNDARSSSIPDPAGGFWVTRSEPYRIVRLSEAGDTTLVIEAAVSGPPVSEQERRDYLAAAEERGPEDLRIATEIAEAMRDSKPAIASIRVDDEGRLWVERTVEGDEPPIFDLFTREGDYVGSVRLGFKPAGFFVHRVRHGAFYTLQRDELDVSYV
ncbi:MAG: hypothetical protein D6701_09800, partial [Gemmatimonadetes bacterium]